MQRYISALGRLLTKRRICNQGIKNNLQTPNVFIRYFVQANSGQNKPAFNGTIRKADFTINELLQYINNGKVFYLKQLTNTFHTIDFSTLKSEEAILLLKCCGSTVPDSSVVQRNEVCQAIFTGLQSNNNLNIDIYNTYLKTCSENNVLVDYKDFLSTIKCEPNTDTFKLLLFNVCQQGQINDALLILELMKERHITVDSDIFNNLILAYTIKGGLELAETVLKTMRSAHISKNNSTKLALLIGLIRRNNFEEFKKALEENPLTFTEDELLSIIKELGLLANESWLSEIQIFYKNVPLTREFQSELEKICIHLVHMGQPVSAMNIYKEFIPPVPEISYGYRLLKDMLHCNIDITTIISIAKDLVNKDYNEYILENLTALALKFKYLEPAWVLLASLKTLRPHYFWPLLAYGGKTNGENGVNSILKNMMDLNVKPDAETLEKYIFPYCDLSDLKLLMLKLQKYGFTVREILSPLLIVLLRLKRTRQAVNLCSLYNVNIFGDELLKLFSTSWGYTKDSNSILTLLRRYCESNITGQDVVGRFMIDCCKLCKCDDDFEEFLKLVKLIGNSRLRVSTHSSDVLQEISDSCYNESLKNEIKASINLILDFGLKLTEDVALTHPRNMDLVGLECHLIELQEKKMETRGVIRKLIQMHTNQGNLKRVTELRKMFLDSGYEESAGIKSSIMHSYVLGGHLDEAISLYKEVKTLNPEFTLDNFKYIDLARLLIINDQFDEGYSILQNETSNSKMLGNIKGIARNCRKLLSACKTGEEIDKVFELLVKTGLCKPTNVVLGPLVKVHLQNGDLNRAVDTYIELSRKYRCTPLQLEILCAVTKQEASELLQKVIKATEAIHGPGPAQIGLISALAENGQEKALRKTLSINNVSIKVLLEKRCERWVEERKIEPLKCLLKACDRLPYEFVNRHFIYKCIFDLFDLNSDYAEALTFYESMPEESSERIEFKIRANQCNINRSENVKIENKI